MTARAVILLGTTMVSYAVMTVVAAILTEGRTQGPLSLREVMVPAAFPLLLVVLMVVASRRRPRT